MTATDVQEQERGVREARPTSDRGELRISISWFALIRT
jgi:hypothetical protein